MVKEAIRIVIGVPMQFEDNTLKKSWIREIKYSFLINRVVAKGDFLSLGGDSLGLFSEPWSTTVWDTTPSGEVKITENTEIEIEELPYLKWEEGGVHHGRFEDYNKWIKDLKKKYGIREI